MPDGDERPVETVPTRPGDILRYEREAQGLTIADIAARTRIPQRHLESIDASDYSGLPSTTYATGFARAYAKALGIDDVAIVSKVRGELAQSWDRPITPHYEHDDPVRVPSRGIAWVGAIVAGLLILAAALWFGTDLLRRGDSAQAPPAANASPAAGSVDSTPVPPPAPVGGQVTLVANDEVWVRVYDAANTTLLMKTMAAGERFEVPAGTDNPRINTGRPDKLTVLVNGSAVAPLGSGRVAIKDVPISAQSLLARGTPAASTPVTAPTPAPTSAATPRAGTPAGTLPPAFRDLSQPPAFDGPPTNATTPD